MKTETKAVEEFKSVEAKEEKVHVELTEEVIQQWKKEFGKVFRSTINGQAIIWRKLKRKDYVKIMSNDEGISKDIYERQEEITKICVLYPSKIEDLIIENGGLATAISDEVLSKSGFDIEDTVEL